LKTFNKLLNTEIYEEEQEQNTFHTEAARGALAEGQSTNEAFVVLKNSSIVTSLLLLFSLRE
tara:strand:- start:478 stop:663 length:186 start_codon:yes stop_codon:yes gene_type:complete